MVGRWTSGEEKTARKRRGGTWLARSYDIDNGCRYRIWQSYMSSRAAFEQEEAIEISLPKYPSHNAVLPGCISFYYLGIRRLFRCVLQTLSVPWTVDDLIRNAGSREWGPLPGRSVSCVKFM